MISTEQTDQAATLQLRLAAISRKVVIAGALVREVFRTTDREATQTYLGGNGGVRLYDDDTINEVNQFGQVISRNQLRQKPTFSPTISGGKVVAITYGGGAGRDGYAANQQVALVLYDPPSAVVIATTTIAADAAGMLAETYSFSPGLGSGINPAIPPLVFADPPPMNFAISRGALLDQGPVAALSRHLPDVYPLPGSFLGAHHFFGYTGSGPNIGPEVSYTSNGMIVVSSDPMAPAGMHAFWSCGPDYGNVIRWAYGNGIFAWGLADKGQGSINFDRYFRNGQEFGPGIPVVSPVSYGTLQAKCTDPTGATGLLLLNDDESSNFFLYSFGSHHSTPGRLALGTQKKRAFSFYTDNQRRQSVTEEGSFVCAPAILPTDAVDGFTYIPTCAGTPTGSPRPQPGTVALVFDTVNRRLCVHDGQWRFGPQM